MYRFKALCRHSNVSGSSVGWVYTDADNDYQARQIFKALYGDLLLTGIAIRV